MWKVHQQRRRACVRWTCTHAPSFSEQVAVVAFVRLSPACVGGLHWCANGPSDRGGALEEPYAGQSIPHLVRPKKQDAEMSSSKGCACASIGRARRIHLSQSRWQSLCVRKKTRPDLRLTFDLISDRSHDLKYGIKRVEDGEIRGY